MSLLRDFQKWRRSRVGFLGLVKPLQERGKGSSFAFFYIMAASLVSLNKAPVLSLSLVGSRFLTLSQFKVFSSIWSLFQLYGESVNVSYIAELHRCFLCAKNFLHHFSCHAHCSRINLCHLFYSFLEFFCWPFLGIISLHHVFGGPCSNFFFQFQIQSIFDLPRVGWWRIP